jgi:hypothetical protein
LIPSLIPLIAPLICRVFVIDRALVQRALGFLAATAPRTKCQAGVICTHGRLVLVTVNMEPTDVYQFRRNLAVRPSRLEWARFSTVR